jgi:periplasmic protein TonB
MGSAELNPKIAASEPELHLSLAQELFEEPLWKSLSRQLDEFFFPKKLPPLKLESKPEPVRDIWGFYDHKKSGVLGSTAVHVLIAGIIIAGTLIGRRIVTPVKAETKVIPLVDPGDIPALKPSKTQVGGGGGGGDRDVLKATKGRLPKLAMEQITPPVVVVRNPNPKLAVEPTIVIPPQVKLAYNMPNLGDPMSSGVLPSNGTGARGGIGEGEGGGVGKGSGPGFGPGSGGGTGGGVFHVGGGVSPPRAINSPEAEFSEEARKAKYQGTCVVGMVVGADGIPRDIRVLTSLGMGLDEKAMEVARKYRFEPARKDGHPVAVEIAVEVDFHLY